MKKSLTLISTGLLAVTLFGTAYAGKDAEHCDYSKKKDGSSLDADQDGSVSREEFMANAEERFKKLDANSDGAIQKEEFKQKHKDMKAKKKEKEISKESVE